MATSGAARSQERARKAFDDFVGTRGEELAAKPAGPPLPPQGWLKRNDRTFRALELACEEKNSVVFALLLQWWLRKEGMDYPSEVFRNNYFPKKAGAPSKAHLNHTAFAEYHQIPKEKRSYGALAIRLFPEKWRSADRQERTRLSNLARQRVKAASKSTRPQ
jgi:hypothetical protein